MTSILRIFFVYILCCSLLPNAYARHYDHSFKHSWHHGSRQERKEREEEHKKIREYFAHHFHKRFKSKKGHDKKCSDTNFKSLAEMRHSRCVEVIEDESSIKITSDHDLSFHPKFKLTTTKALIIEARDLYLKNHAKLFAGRMIINIEDQLKSDKHSQLCAQVIVLEAARSKLKGQACQSAQVIGSVVGKPSAIAVLKVLPLPESPTVPQTVNFDWSESFGVCDEATLDLGNGMVVNTTEKNASYVYEEAGSYDTQVKLNTPGGVALSNVESFTLQEANPIADFALLHLIRNPGTPPEAWIYPNLYPLVDLEQYQIKEYRYTFSDGTSVILPFAQSPDGFVIHTFPSMGEYDVTLEVVTTDGFSKTVTTTLNLNNPSNPVPRYAVSSFKGQAPLTVTLTGEGQDNEDSEVIHYWVMPDTGEVFYGTEFGQIEHTFNESGIFYVRYEVRNSLRGNRITYIPIYVGVEPENDAMAPVAVIDASARFGSTPLTVNFSGVRSFIPNGNNANLSYYWNFSDWKSGTFNEAFTANAVHTFEHPGSFFVTLTVFDQISGLSHSENIYVYVDGNDTSDLEFAVTPTGNMRELYFSAQNFFQETDYTFPEALWSFGDGVFAANYPDVSHQYAASGTYDVELKMRRPDGAYDLYTRRLVVSDNMTAPMASIQAQNEWFNVGEPTQLAANFIEGSSSAGTIYRWQSGDGVIHKGQGDQFKNIVHTYSMEESMQVRLMVVADNGLTSQAEYWLQPNRFAPEINGLNIYGIENPIAPVTLGFAPHETTLDHDGNFDHFIYEFGDGTPAITTSEGYLEHTYATSGVYSIAITAVDSAGKRTRFEQQIEIKDNQPPVLGGLNLHYDINAVAPLSVQAELWPHADSDGWVTAFEVEWGDGSSQVENQHQIDHLYYDAGIYTVRARVQDNYGAWSEWVSTSLEVKANQAPVIAHVPIYGDLNQPAPNLLGFAPHEGSSDDQYIERWIYNPGDGSPVVETTDGYFEHEYLFPGNFTMVVTAIDPYGLSSTYTIPLEIKANQPPVLADFNLNLPNERAPVEVAVEAWPFASDSDGFVDLYEYIWGDGSSEQSAEGYVTHIYQQAGDYQVSVRVRDNYGEWSELITKTATIVGNQAPIAKIIADKNTVLVPDTIHLSALESSDAEGDPLIYEWTRPDGSTTNEAEIELELTEVGEHTVTLKVTDSYGAENSSSIVLEGKLPFENAIILTKSSDIAPSTLTMQAQKLYDDNGNPLTFEWFVNGEKKSQEANFSILITEPGPVDILLVSIDEDGFRYEATVSETLNAPPLFFTLNQYEAYAPVGDSVEFQLIGLTIDSPDYQVEITTNSPDAVIENVSASSFKITSSMSGVPIEINVLATNGADSYGRQAVVEFVMMQEIFNQSVADIPMPVEYQGETLMQVSSPVDGNIFAKLGLTSNGQMIVEVSSNDVNPKRISILGLNPNYSVTASQFVSSFHTGENIGAEKSPINDLTRDWVKVCHTPNPGAKRTIFKFNPEITPDQVDPVYLRELTLDNQSKVKIGFRSTLTSLFLNQQGELDESLPIIVALKNALNREVFNNLVPIWVLSKNDPFLSAKKIGAGVDGYVSSHLQVVHVFKEAILREGEWASKKDYYPFFLLAHEYRHIEQYENCDFMNNLTKFDVDSGAVVAESSADLSAMKKVAALPNDGVYTQISGYNEVRSPDGINEDMNEGIIDQGLQDSAIEKQAYSNEFFFDLLVDDEYEFVRKVVENSANTSHIPLLQNYINTPGYDYPNLVTNYLASFSQRYSSLGFDLSQAALNPVGLDTPSPVGPYGFGYLKIEANDLVKGMQNDGSFRIKIEHDSDVKFVLPNALSENAFNRKIKAESYEDGTIISFEIHRDEQGQFRTTWDGYFAVLNSSYNSDQKFRVVQTEGVCFKDEGVYVPWTRSCTQIGEPLVFSSTYEKPWQFEFASGFSESDDILYYLNPKNGNYEIVPQTYDGQIPVYVDSNQLVTNVWGETYKMILVRPSLQKIFTGYSNWNTGNFEREMIRLSEPLSPIDNLSIDRDESFRFKFTADVPWERHPHNPRDAEIRIYHSNPSTNDYTLLYTAEVNNGGVEFDLSFSPSNQAIGSSVRYDLYYQLYYRDNQYSTGYGVGIKSPPFVKCAEDEAFSRVKRKCGKTQVSEFVHYSCAPVVKTMTSEICTQWTLDLIYGICDSSVVYDCNDPYGPERITYCEGFGDPPPNPVTRTINMSYHDFQAEQDDIYSLTCNFVLQ